MKTLLQIALVVTIGLMKAQIPNNSFENLNANGTIKNWGAMYLFAVVIDSNGVSHADSIVMDHDFYFSSPDAHTGSKALEMRNATNYTAGYVIPGRASLSANDSDYTAFISPVSIQQQPLSFTFYYKFHPAGPDTATGIMLLVDSNGTIVGDAVIEITSQANNYVQAAKPIHYYGTGTSAAFVSIEFSTAKPGSTATFGTRFLVDDVGFVYTTTGIPVHEKTHELRCFPNPATNLLSLQLNDAATTEQATIRLYDVQGKLIRETAVNTNSEVITVPVEDLSQGIYTLNLITTQQNYFTKFIK